MQAKVCTVVLNWNGWRDTSECLASLRHLTYGNNEVIVVDNGSTDESVAQLRSQFPGAILIEAGNNLGFSAGCNLGIRRALAAGAEFIWLLNNDALVDPAALTALVNRALSDESVAAVGSAIYFMHQPTRLQVWGGGRINFLLGRSRHCLKPVPDHALDYITGASLLLRSSALEEAGFLDEDFFFFWEDADLGFRLRRAGWNLAVAGNSKVWHKQSASLRQQSVLLDTYFNQSACRFFRKHARVPQIPLYAGIILRFLKRMLTGQFRRAGAVWSACRQSNAVNAQLRSVRRLNPISERDLQGRNAE